MEQLIKEFETRRSIRKYQNKPLTNDQIETLIEAARLSPSGSNTQPWRFLAIRDRGLMEKIAKVDHDQAWMLEAPLFIACMADPACRPGAPAGMQLEDSPENGVKMMVRDTGSAIEHLLLQADHMGLGTCWTGWFTQKEMHEVLSEAGVPDEFYIVGIITVGYPGEAPAARPRKPLDEILRYEKWQ